MTRVLFAVALALTTALGCASVPEPDWLQALRAREAEPLPPQKIQSSDRFFGARVPAKLAGPIQLDDEAYRVSLDVGATAPVDCWVYRDGIDFAGSLSGLSESTFSAISQTFGEVELRKVDRVDAGVIEGSPFVAIDWMYRVKTDAGPQIGQVKHLVTSKGGRGLYCQHNELGYAKTFLRVVGAILESLEYRTPNGPEPYFSEISTMSVRGMRVGVEYTTLVRDEEDTRIDTRMALLLPVTAEELQVSDSFGVEFARPDGTLINQVHIESANGEVVSHLKLDPAPGGGWTVEGTYQGKPLSAKIEPGDPPSSWLGEAYTLRRSLADDGAPGSQITLARWVPEADPTRLVEQTLSIGRQVDAERFAAKVAAAGLEADLVVDRKGTVAAGTIDMGVASVDFERVFTGGAF